VKRLTISLPESLVEDLDHTCMANGASRSANISDALERMLHNCCCICGVPWANDWMTSDGVWDHYITPPYRAQILCRRCWNQAADARDRGRFEAKHRQAWIARQPTTNK
jgi:hypothetical protein